MPRVCRIGIFVCAVLLCAGSALAQATATLRGRVVDPQRSPVQGAVVTVSRQDTAFSRSVTTEADGTFV
ncbi:MAG TPA: carboxypeptidase-like regulatory domain-containing protein, partial [Vicinamibacterales bacterium]|nr:carboxypeptidase-like regulatory domain-containing protein [Vicinamibacterales bacterium]